MLTGICFTDISFFSAFGLCDQNIQPMMTETTELDKQHIINRMQIDLLADQIGEAGRTEKKTVEDLKTR